MTKKLAVYQHSPWEGPGRFLLEAAKANKIELSIINAWEAVFPSPTSYDGFILLGGSANVDEEDRYPFLVAEKKSIEEILTADKPCLGICLGHQLLASVSGAQIGPNFCHSIGLSQAFLTTNGRKHPLFQGIDSPFPVFKWHAQAVIPPVPRHFHILATSQECQVEAFTIKERPHIVGVQFDNHAGHPDDAKVWYEKDYEWLSSLHPAPVDIEVLLGTLAAEQELLKNQFKLLFSAFCALL